MSNDDDDSFDDDDDFIALTLKPPTYTQLNHEINDHHTQLSQLPIASQADLVAAKGEIAILRAKLKDIEKNHSVEKVSILNQIQNDKSDKESKIKALDNKIKQLEDENKFLQFEKKSQQRKKRKTLTNLDPDLDIVPESQSNQPIPSAIITDTPVTQIPTVLPKQDHIEIETNIYDEIDLNQLQLQPMNEKILIQLSLIASNDNTSFIDHITSHVIIGTSKPVMDILSQISLTFEFSHDLLTIPINEPVSTCLLKHLLTIKSYKLNDLISTFIKNLVILINEIFALKDESLYLPIPFLLSLIYSSFTFRRSAIDQITLQNLINFSIEKLSILDNLLKPKEEYEEYYKRHQRISINVIQVPFLKNLILQYTLELFETLLVNIGDDVTFNREIFKKIQPELNGFIKLGLSVHSCINIIFSIVEILSSILHTYEHENEDDHDGNGFLGFINLETIQILISLIKQGIPWKEMWLFNGMIRILGNSLDNQQIEKLLSKDSIETHPQVVYPIDYNTKTFEITNNHQVHLMSLNFQILQFLETFLIVYDHIAIELFNKDINNLRSIILTIANQQEFLLRNPRDNLTHLRSKLINSLVRIVHLIWQLNSDMTDKASTSPLLTKDSTYILMIVLSRIAFSNNETSSIATKFLLHVRKDLNLKRSIFNKWAEDRAKEIAHLNINDDTSLENLVNAEIGLSNGLEFGYDDDVVELSRDLLERFTTGDEADELYLSININ